MSWTQDRTETMTRLWLDGFSASETARALGDDVSRNAVIGKVFRLKLKRHDSAPSVAKNKRPKTAASSAKRDRSTASKERTAFGRIARALETPIEYVEVDGEAWEALPGTTPVSIMDLTAGTCRWPIGDPKQAGFGYCGCQVAEGSSYCPTHRKRSIGTGTVAERMADRGLSRHARMGESRILDVGAA